jgi:hypothetical protein
VSTTCFCAWLFLPTCDFSLQIFQTVIPWCSGTRETNDNPDLSCTQSASLTSRLPLRATGRVIWQQAIYSYTGHLFGLQGRRHLQESPMTTGRNRRFHISTTFCWRDLTSTSANEGVLASDAGVTFLFGIGGEGIMEFEVEWAHKELYKLLYAFIYQLYEPGDFADETYIKTEFDEEFTAKYTIKITYSGRTQECPDLFHICQKSVCNSYTCPLEPTLQIGRQRSHHPLRSILPSRKTF